MAPDYRIAGTMPYLIDHRLPSTGVVHRRLSAFRLKHDFKRNLFAFGA